MKREEKKRGQEEQREKENRSKQRKERKRQNQERQEEERQQVEEESRHRKEERQEEERNIKDEEDRRRMDDEALVETERHFNTDENSQEDPIIINQDRRAMLKERSHTKMGQLNEVRVTLDVGGRHFATSRKWMLGADISQPVGRLSLVTKTIFKTMLTAGVHHYVIDGDGGHFRYILNFPRAEGSESLASLLRENRYLIELQNESVYYNLTGLEELVTKHLEMYRTLPSSQCHLPDILYNPPTRTGPGVRGQDNTSDHTFTSLMFKARMSIEQ